MLHVAVFHASVAIQEGKKATEMGTPQNIRIISVFLTFVCTSREVFFCLLVFLGFFWFFFQYKDKFDQFGQVLKQATKRPWKMVDTY